ncbi:SPOR domain-containing protein [Streptantibioticus rubrisoli]|uniref:SPOR domain-containing protein n=1 Tax=Streptantibioticus rubrisoli TaxID=1387313 RepID=A0ABT1PF80_9ACTN|nr:SPOR domain-containing protein [Streptantibioticus rubrisoli]MCQ4044027.1 SPOR domain-containing protein [Streptantibioticus rubrisoli]
MGELQWAVIRQDDNGNRYRVASCETREEAETVAGRFDGRGTGCRYLVERIDHPRAS